MNNQVNTLTVCFSYTVATTKSAWSLVETYWQTPAPSCYFPTTALYSYFVQQIYPQRTDGVVVVLQTA